MEGKQFKTWFAEVAKANGFERRRDCWFQSTGDLTRVVNLQKSSFDNSYYVNFGFIVNSVPLGQLLMHIGYRLSSPNPDERAKIEELLNLDSPLDDTTRESGLRFRLSRDVYGQLQKTTTEADLLFALKKQPHMNSVPLSVKKHFNLHY